MSKIALKKELQKLTQEQLIEQILELYQTNKSVKEYYEFYLNPLNEKDLFEKYKAIIVQEFYPKGKYPNPKMRFSVCKKAIADFRALKPSTELLAELMVVFAEMACEFTYEFGDMWEQYYISAANNYEAALKFLQKNNMLEIFQLRAKQCLKWANECGWGFGDDIDSVYYNYYNEEQ
jgi:hypothetical protein